jgi:hypothetical protein
MNMNTPPISTGRVSSADLGKRLRESAAVLAIADQIDAERRFGIWPPRRGGALTDCSGPCAQGRRACPCPDACERLSSDDDHGFTRGMLFAAVVFVAFCAAAALLLPAVLP